MITSDNSQVLIIVLSGNYSTGLGLVRSLGAEGYTVDLISLVKRRGSSVIASSSKYVRRSSEVFFSPEPGINQQNILDMLSGYREEKELTKILIPADDAMANLLDSRKASLSEDFLIAGQITEGRESLEHLMNKGVQGKYALLFGLKRPEEWTVDLRVKTDIPEGMSFPCFIKPLKSIEGNKMEMAMAQDAAELEACLDKFRQEDSDRSVLVQRYLKVDKEYDLGGVCLDDKVIIPGVIEKIRVAQYERGVTLAGKMVSREVLGETLDKVCDLMKSFHFTGLFDLEFILSEGELYFNEINFRAGGPNYAYTLNGANLPAALIKGILGEEVTPSDLVITESMTFVYEKVAWEEHIQGYMSKKELDNTISGADKRLLSNDDDPTPGKIFGRRIRLSLLKHKLLGRGR